MGMYKYVRELWKNPSENMPELMRQRLVDWTKEEATTRLERPTRIDRARSLGYKAKPGVIIVRQRVMRGGRTRDKIRKGRRTKHRHHTKILALNYQAVCEQRANQNYVNCEVLNSYHVGETGKYVWYEVILIDRAHPAILADKSLANVAAKRGRIYRGLTHAAKKSRQNKNGKWDKPVRP